MFENCRDYEESVDNCASVDDTNAFWDANFFTLAVLFPLKQVLLKDMDEPMKSVRPWAATQVGKLNVDKID